MVTALNRLIELVEARPDETIDVAGVARAVGTTEYHLRRMFSSLTGMSVSEYVRRRRMTLAAADIIGGERVLDVAVRYGYGSTEAFGRAFRAVHGATPAEVRRHGGPLRSQPHLRLRLTVEGTHPMDTRIVRHPSFQLIGHAVTAPLIHAGVNPVIRDHVASIAPAEHERLKALSAAEPRGLLQVSDGVDPDYVEGTPLTYLHGVAVPADADVPSDLDAIRVEAGDWAVFRAAGGYPDALQAVWAATATDWFPANPWRLRPGPSIVAVVDRSPDFATATTDLWLPVEAG